jgi:peptidoglycan hydrolase-like protein with peptidoglycan-binding domain
VGAFDVMYELGTAGPDGSAIGLGCIAIKRELKYNGSSFGQDDQPKIGTNADKAIRAFQEAEALVVDGQAGPITCRHLFRKRARSEQSAYHVAGQLVERVKTLESDNDPAAEGVVDPDDWGLGQINLPQHADVTFEQALDPAFVIPYMARGLASAYKSIGDWDGAGAAWNVGTFYAGAWVAAGKPASGHVVGSIDWFARAYRYVALVHAQPL